MITLGSDIGGTFTDFVEVDESNGQVEVYKCLTTPDDPSRAIDEGVRVLSARQARTASAYDIMIHGTTLVINAVIERKGAKTGLITTLGFRDILEIGREKRYDAFDLRIRFPEPLVPRRLRVEVTGRMHASGVILTPLDEGSVRDAVRKLLDERCESLAVCLLHSYRNPVHERRVRDIIEEISPGMPVSLSSDVLPEFREYERTTTTTINAYAKPITGRYLTRLEERVRAQGFEGELLMMQSSGGINSVAVAREFPVQIIESGPAAGTLGAARFAQLAKLDKVLAFDMGGTTAKLALVVNGQAIRTNDFEVAHVHRFKRGSGIPVRVPVVDLMEIGAGGGSIARRTAVGTLQVGPESSSAVPGPACYGQGGTQPTVSDGDLILGYLDADHFLGGRMKLNKAAAERAVHDVLAVPLGITTEEAAFGIYAIVNENMSSAAKAYVSEHGESPKACALVAFGGAGPVHASDLAARLGITTVLIPPRAGVAAAFGMIAAPVSYDAVRSRRMLLSNLSAGLLREIYMEMVAECLERLPKTVNQAEIVYELSVDMRYLGQGFDVSVPLPSGDSEEAMVASAKEAFGRTYLKLYGCVFPHLALEIMNFRLSAISKRKVADLEARRSKTGDSVMNSMRRAFCPKRREWLQFAVWRRADMDTGVSFSGPMIVEEDESTTVVPSGAMARVDAYGSLIINLAN